MLCEDLKFCKAKIFQIKRPIEDVSGRVRDALLPAAERVRAGGRIAVAVGSRGIANIAVIVKAAVDMLNSCGARPFIIPAMGSHGGATAEGQQAVLGSYGITEASMGVEVCSSMETVPIGYAGGAPRIPVFMDRYAYESDGVVVINRVKSHTDFHGAHESGIVKMLVIGLGKQKAAVTMHGYGAAGLRDFIPAVAKEVLATGKILFGITVVEDGSGHTASVGCALPENFFEADRAALALSRELGAKLPVSDIDILLVDRMGKDISGTGMDTNVLGRMRIEGEDAAGMPPLRAAGSLVAVLDLTESSHGNALGIGLADITTRRLAEKIDWQSTNANVLTSGFLQRGFLPIVAKDDMEAINTALELSGKGSRIRFARIRDTLRLEEAYLSKALTEQLLDEKRGEADGVFAPLRFCGGRIEKF